MLHARFQRGRRMASSCSCTLRPGVSGRNAAALSTNWYQYLYLFTSFELFVSVFTVVHAALWLPESGWWVWGHWFSPSRRRWWRHPSCPEVCNIGCCGRQTCTCKRSDWEDWLPGGIAINVTAGLASLRDEIWIWIWHTQSWVMVIFYMLLLHNVSLEAGAMAERNDFVFVLNGHWLVCFSWSVQIPLEFIVHINFSFSSCSYCRFSTRICLLIWTSVPFLPQHKIESFLDRFVANRNTGLLSKIRE